MCNPAGRHRTRLPIQPLERLIGQPTARELGARFGVQKGTVYSWRVRGLSFDQADRIAVAHGIHPIEVWGDDWFLPDWVSSEEAAA